MHKFIKPAVVICMFSLSACYYDNLEELHIGENTCTVPDTSSYSLHVAPIMTASCGTSNSGCHETRTSENKNVGLANYNDVVDAIGKKLMSAITHDGNASEMPKGGGKLSDCHIETIQKWIDQGAQNN